MPTKVAPPPYAHFPAGTAVALLLPQSREGLCPRLRGHGSRWSASQGDIPWKRNPKLPALPANVKNIQQRMEVFCTVGTGERKAAPFVLSRDNLDSTSLSCMNTIHSIASPGPTTSPAAGTEHSSVSSCWCRGAELPWGFPSFQLAQDGSNGSDGSMQRLQHAAAAQQWLEDRSTFNIVEKILVALEAACLL